MLSFAITARASCLCRGASRSHAPIRAGTGVAASVAAHSARAASADAHLGVSLLEAGFEGARSNLESELSSFIDATHVTSVVDEIARLSDETTAATRAAASLLEAPPA